MNGSGDRVGLCLDVDGTLRRDGSVFLETAVRLPEVLPLSRSDRRHLRRALGAVGRYRGGRPAELRWRATLSVVDGLRAIDPSLGAAALNRIADRRSSAGDRTGDDGPRGSYDRMRRRLLRRYGRALAGHDREAVRAGAAAVLAEHRPIDDGIAGTLGDLDVEVALVTDMPEHVAAPFAEVALAREDAAVVGTRYGAEGGRLVGSFESVDKGAAVADLRERRGWSRTVAVGDTERDLAMAAVADRFVGVGGRGGIRSALEDPVVLDPTTGRDDRVVDGATTVYVPPGASLATALRAVAGG